jgi:hypothetical protein
MKKIILFSIPILFAVAPFFAYAANTADLPYSSGSSYCSDGAPCSGLVATSSNAFYGGGETLYAQCGANNSATNAAIYVTGLGSFENPSLTSLGSGNYSFTSNHDYTATGFYAVAITGFSGNGCAGDLQISDAPFGGGGGGGGSSTPAIAPINNRTSTATVAGNVTSELISFPLYILKTYGNPLVWIAILFALTGAIYGLIKLVRL